jgi:hypothetical protein
MKDYFNLKFAALRPELPIFFSKKSTNGKNGDLSPILPDALPPAPCAMQCISRIGTTFLWMTLRLQNQGQIFDPINLTGSWTLSNLPVLLLLLHLSLLFEAFLRGLLAFLYSFAFLFHNTLLSAVFLCLGSSRL